MRVAPGLFSCSMVAGLLAFSSRQYTPTINRGPLSASHYFSFLSKLRGRHTPPAERSALHDIRIPICTMATDGSASAASEIEVGSVYPTMQELRVAAEKQADTCVAGVEWCGMWRVEGVSPYVGIRIGGIGWGYGVSLIG